MPISLNKTPLQFDLKKKESIWQKIKHFCVKHKFAASFFLFIIALLSWLFFPKFFFWIMGLILNKDFKLNDEIGGIGDVYGSLNTLFTFLTLCVVLYSTYKQVKLSLELQKNANLQLDAGVNNHKEQMKESRRALFNEMFYSLLNYKREKFEQLNVVTKKGNLSASELTNAIYKEFLRLLEKKWSNLEKIDQESLSNEFKYFVNKITNGKGYEQLYTYFYMYESIYKLINNEELTPNDESFYKDLVSNSMTPGEQITLVWIAASSSYHCGFLKNSYFIVYHMPKGFIAFAEKFLDQSLFIHPQFLREWNEYRKDKNPA
ncbi:hypothetical protein [Acinetobacter pittii]|uniref:hypothetical protein n=1 Tax=Acinetobacter pittii TaxID=48296 RepID=UPI000C78F4E2|nr:hypothetical protein [Acinetobacter pittii]AUM28572.1 hypothetical protein BVD86_17815 [Acinetobacter pittii]